MTDSSAMPSESFSLSPSQTPSFTASPTRSVVDQSAPDHTALIAACVVVAVVLYTILLFAFFRFCQRRGFCGGQQEGTQKQQSADEAGSGEVGSGGSRARISEAQGTWSANYALDGAHNGTERSGMGPTHSDAGPRKASTSSRGSGSAAGWISRRRSSKVAPAIGLGPLTGSCLSPPPNASAAPDRQDFSMLVPDPEDSESGRDNLPDSLLPSDLTMAAVVYDGTAFVGEEISPDELSGPPLASQKMGRSLRDAQLVMTASVDKDAGWAGRRAAQALTGAWESGFFQPRSPVAALGGSPEGGGSRGKEQAREPQPQQEPTPEGVVGSTIRTKSLDRRRSSISAFAAALAAEQARAPPQPLLDSPMPIPHALQRGADTPLERQLTIGKAEPPPRRRSVGDASPGCKKSAPVPHLLGSFHGRGHTSSAGQQESASCIY